MNVIDSGEFVIDVNQYPSFFACGVGGEIHQAKAVP
jgi:hypothetical protein